MNLPFPYQLIRSNKRHRTTSVRLLPEKGVIVHAPKWVSLSEIEHFLFVKQNWILRNLKKLKTKAPLKKQFQDGESHLYFGEAFPLKVTLTRGKSRSQLTLLYDRFEALIPSHFTPLKQKYEIKEAFTKWYLKQGKKIIAKKVDHFCQLLNVSYNRITLKRVSSIWGSCSRKNNLNFNRKLIMAPHAVVDYVVIHEVCHLIHRHHQQSFWDEVKKLSPDYKKHIAWLKQNSYLLTL